MQISVDLLPIGTHFFYKNEEFIVEDRTDYPFIYASCLTTPNEYEGLQICFCYQQVTAYVNEIYEQYFEETSKNHYQLREKLTKKEG